MNNHFGDFLREARKASGFKTQKEAADVIARHGRKFSQGYLAQIENGKIKDPDPTILRLLAQIYRKDYMEIIYHLMRAKYDPEREWESSPLTRQRLRMWEASLLPTKDIDGVKGLEVHQMKAKADLITETILDVKGLAEWERNLPELEFVWIVATASLNDRGSQILESVVHNMRRGVQMIYFVRQEDIDKGGRFWELERLLKQLNIKPLEDKPLNYPLAVPLTEEQLRWLNTDIVIANPHWRSHASGFRYIRRARGSSYAIRMLNRELIETIGHLRRYAALANLEDEKAVEKVLQEKFPDALEEMTHVN